MANAAEIISAAIVIGGRDWARRPTLAPPLIIGLVTLVTALLETARARSPEGGHYTHVETALVPDRRKELHPTRRFGDTEQSCPPTLIIDDPTRHRV